MRLRTILAVPIVVAAATAASAGPLWAQQYPPGATTLVLGRSEVRPGEPVPVSGSGCPSSSNVPIDFDTRGNGIGETQATPQGSFATEVDIPASAAPGPHTLIATCGTRELRAGVQVLGVAVARDGTLPRTGTARAGALGLAGAGLVVVGSLAVLAVRRRRSPLPG